MWDACNSNTIPADLSAEFAQIGCGGNQHFLLPLAKGSATVAVPLSLDTQAAQREEGREGGKRKRRRKRRRRVVMQARQRERSKEAESLCV